MNKERGATTIIIAVLITSVILTIALAATAIIVSEINMSQQLADSIPAYYAAEAGAEKCLYQARCAAIEPDTSRTAECDQATGGAGAFNQGCVAAGQSINNQSAVLPITLPDSGAKIEQAQRSGGNGKEINAAGSYNQTKRSVELTW